MAAKRYRYFRDKAEREATLERAVALGQDKLAEIVGKEGADVLIAKYRGYPLADIGEWFYPNARSPVIKVASVVQRALVTFARKTTREPDYFRLFRRDTAEALRAAGFESLIQVQDAVRKGEIDGEGRYQGERLPGLAPDQARVLHAKIDALRTPAASRPARARYLLRGLHH